MGEDGEPLMPMSQKDKDDQDIDIENFALGEGTMTQKKQRLDRLVGRLIDDDILFKKFRGNKSNIK